jgi:protein disulfide-isomerase-like protein
VYKNYDAIVNDPTKDVLVEFYAPWCMHCQAFYPVLVKVAEDQAKNSTLVMGQFDMTANTAPDLPEGFEVSGFPTVYLFPANNKKAVRVYEGDRTEEDVHRFIRGEPTHAPADDEDLPGMEENLGDDEEVGGDDSEEEFAGDEEGADEDEDGDHNEDEDFEGEEEEEDEGEEEEESEDEEFGEDDLPSEEELEDLLADENGEGPNEEELEELADMLEERGSGPTDPEPHFASLKDKRVVPKKPRDEL